MGTFSSSDIQRVLQGTHFYTDKKKYAFVKLERKDYQHILDLVSHRTSEYVEIIYDKDELTLIILEETWQELSKKITPVKIDELLAIITCEVKEPTVTGYLFALIQKLSPAGISVFVQAAFTTDHIFVYHTDLEKALAILNEVKANGVN